MFPCGGAPTIPGTVDTSRRPVLDATVNGTIYQYVLNYEASTGKKYKFKNQEERMRYMLEAMKPENCPVIE